MHYIQQYIANILEKQDAGNHYYNELHAEMQKLDPLDFEPAAQAALMSLRVKVRALAEANRTSPTSNRELLEKVSRLFDQYKGLGSGGKSRRFPYIADVALRDIIERDYGEIRMKLFPSRAWKSTVVMAGSVLEAILFDRLADARWNAAAVASPQAQARTGRQIPMDDWRLEMLINIAVAINLLPSDPADTIHRVLRDYRNFVHPKKEIRSAHACTEAEAMLAVGALDSVCNFIEKNP